MENAIDPESAPWSQAVQGLIERVTGGFPGNVSLRTLRSPGRRFQYESTARTLVISATDAISACVGFHTYLRQQHGIAVHWDTSLPVIVDDARDCPAVEREARVSLQYMFNFCTFSYTMANWTWEQWEREIDWMALHGVTMPLATTGHEAVLLDAYTGLGLSEEDVLVFLGADTYSAFTFMGNLDSVIAPSTRARVEERAELGRRILERERSLGMTPVLPAFTGNVPRALAPDRVTERTWQGFTTHVVHPSDPAFAAVAAAVVTAQRDRFGSDHLYAADPFIEMIPVEDGQDFPGQLARSLLGALSSVDPDATWVLQSWPFSYQSDFWTGPRVNDFLASIPAERLIVLDLWAEADPQWDKYDGFAGRAWVWCALLNFGGRSEPIGDVQRAVDEFERALASGTRPIGLGLTMEATRNNALYFELVSDLAWTPVHDVRAWTSRFAVERYGRLIPEAAEAWGAALDTVYSRSGRRVFPEDFLGLLSRRPTTVLEPGIDAVRESVRSLVWFDPRRLQDMFELFLSAARAHPRLTAGPLGHDLADAAIAWALRLFDALVVEALERRRSGDRPAAADRANILGLIDDLDAVLATRPELRLSTWLGSSSRLRDADPAATRASRQILTSWNNEPRRQLDDYSARIWHGLLHYYRERWAAWLDASDQDVERSLDRVWERFMADGAPEAPPSADGQSTASAAAELLRRFGSAFATSVSRHGTGAA